MVRTSVAREGVATGDLGTHGYPVALREVDLVLVQDVEVFDFVVAVGRLIWKREPTRPVRRQRRLRRADLEQPTFVDVAIGWELFVHEDQPDQPAARGCPAATADHHLGLISVGNERIEIAFDQRNDPGAAGGMALSEFLEARSAFGSGLSVFS